MSMSVVIRQTHTRKLEFLGRLDRMGIVVAQNPFAVRLMQRQRLTNAMRSIGRRRHSPSVDLDPETISLINDLAIQV